MIALRMEGPPLDDTDASAWELCPRCAVRIPPEAEHCARCRQPLGTPAPATGVPMVQDLVWVFGGTPERVLALQAALVGEGFTTHIPDLSLRTMADPFGWNCLGFDLLASRGQAPAVAAAIERLTGADPVGRAAPVAMRALVAELGQHVSSWWRAQTPFRQSCLRGVMILGAGVALVLVVAHLSVLVTYGPQKQR